MLGFDFPSHRVSSPGIDNFDAEGAKATHSANVAFTRKFVDLKPDPKVEAAVRPVESVEDLYLSHIPTHIVTVYRHAAQARVDVGRLTGKDRRD